MPVNPLAFYFVPCNCFGRDAETRIVPLTPPFSFLFPPLNYWTETSRFKLTFNVKFSRNYWHSYAQNINDKCASGTQYSLLMHPGRTFYLNLFKCIYSDSEGFKQTSALGEPGQEQWVSGTELI